MAVTTAADRLSEARRRHQEAVRFACEFWEASDLLSSLSRFIVLISTSDVGADGTALEIGLSLRRLIAEKCISRWELTGEDRFRSLDRALYQLHVALHEGRGVVTGEAQAASFLVRHELELASWRDSV